MKLAFVHVVDQIQFEPETAQLAALAQEASGPAGEPPRLVLTDYGTADSAVLAGIAGADHVLIRVTRPTLPVVEHLLSRLGEVPGAPHPILYGPLVWRDPELVTLAAPEATLLAGESEVGLAGLLEASRAGRLPEAPPPGVRFVRGGRVLDGPGADPLPADGFPNPNFGVFGGSELFRRGIGCSFFGETGVFPLELSVGCAAGPAPNAALASFFRQVPTPPRSRTLEQIEDRLLHMRRDFPLVRGVELRDRDFGADRVAAEAFLEHLEARHRDLAWSLRGLAEGLDGDLVGRMAAAGVRRLVLEFDRGRAGACPGVPGLGDPEAVERVLRGAAALGLETGLLVSVGLPRETEEDIAAKLQSIRSWGVARVRFLPFEPEDGHPVRGYCEDAGLLPDGEDSWNREVHHPLVQPELDEESWHRSWQACLDLQAELQTTRGADFGGPRP